MQNGEPMKRTPLTTLIAIVGALWSQHDGAADLRAADGKAPPARPPNVVVIISDDQGYADVSFNPRHPPEVSTPHTDALARAGVAFTQAYTSGVVCSPTRAGLMLGRYQHRVGVYTAGEGGSGFDPAVPIFPAFLPAAYVSTALGKWHLGLDTDYPQLKWHPVSRGFDECYNFMGRGGHDYFRLKGEAGGADATLPLYRGKQRIGDEGYLTTRLTEEAVAFIGRNKANPFFLYLAYNAVHAPAQAPQASIDRVKTRFPDLAPERQVLMAMLHHLDEGVGAVTGKLRDENLFENTIVVYLTDNGGSKSMRASNAPLRGFKGSHYEGGIRTPFVVSWPARFAGGRSIATPVMSLDVLPTVLDAIGAAPPAAAPPFDGKSLLPLLTGEATAHHDVLYWSGGGTAGDWAVRQENWKLHAIKDQVELTDLAADPGETANLAAKHPDRVKAMTALYDAWIEKMSDPIAGGSKRWDPAAEPKAKRPKKAKPDVPVNPAATAPPQVGPAETPDKPADPAPTPREQEREKRRIERKQEREAAKTGAAASRPAAPARRGG